MEETVHLYLYLHKKYTKGLAKNQFKYIFYSPKERIFLQKYVIEFKKYISIPHIYTWFYWEKRNIFSLKVATGYEPSVNAFAQYYLGQVKSFKSNLKTEVLRLFSVLILQNFRTFGSIDDLINIKQNILQNIGSNYPQKLLKSKMYGIIFSWS